MSVDLLARLSKLKIPVDFDLNNYEEEDAA